MDIPPFGIWHLRAPFEHLFVKPVHLRGTWNGRAAREGDRQDKNAHLKNTRVKFRLNSILSLAVKGTGGILIGHFQMPRQILVPLNQFRDSIVSSAKRVT